MSLSLWAQSPSHWRLLPSRHSAFTSAESAGLPSSFSDTTGHHDGKWQLPAQRPLLSYPHPYLTFSSLSSCLAASCVLILVRNILFGFLIRTRPAVLFGTSAFVSAALSFSVSVPEHRPAARLLYQLYCDLHCRLNRGLYCRLNKRPVLRP